MIASQINNPTTQFQSTPNLISWENITITINAAPGMDVSIHSQLN